MFVHHVISTPLLPTFPFPSPSFLSSLLSFLSLPPPLLFSLFLFPLLVPCPLLPYLAPSINFIQLLESYKYNDLDSTDQYTEINGRKTLLPKPPGFLLIRDISSSDSEIFKKIVYIIEQGVFSLPLSPPPPLSPSSSSLPLSLSPFPLKPTYYI